MEFLFNISVRCLILAALAAIGLWVFRVKAPGRHAVWTLVTAGMLLQAVLVPTLPTMRLRVLRPVTLTLPAASVDEDSPGLIVHSTPSRGRNADQLVGGVYAIGFLWFAAHLVYAAWFTRRLVRDSVLVSDRRYECGRISVPLTVGPRILLPPDWREWDAGKLAAVLAHEEAHVVRADWAVAAIARVNRCVFWFHPLAWWLERELARLAEQICDDEALAVTQDCEMYASVLLEMARAAGSRGRRVVGAVAMAKETNVEMRINRILDAGRQAISKPISRPVWIELSICAALIVYAAAAVQLAPAQVSLQTSPAAQAPVPDAPHPQLLAQASSQRPPAQVRQTTPADTGVGSLSGIVRDPSGARVPNASVVIHGPRAVLTVSTNLLGEWFFPGLPAGSYSVAVLATGFAGNRVVAVDVAGGVERKIDTNLTIGSTSVNMTITATGTPRSASVTAESETPRVGGNVEAPRLVKRINPAYPAAARDQGISGPVVMTAVLGKDGTVLHAQVTNDAPSELRDSALQSVQGWIYKPELLNGEPVESLITVTVNFQLSSSK